jgi:hypothetical protein
MLERNYRCRSGDARAVRSLTQVVRKFPPGLVGVEAGRAIRARRLCLKGVIAAGIAVLIGSLVVFLLRGQMNSDFAAVILLAVLVLGLGAMVVNSLKAQTLHLITDKKGGEENFTLCRTRISFNDGIVRFPRERSPVAASSFSSTRNTASADPRKS